MHQISNHLGDYDCYFTPYYCDGIYRSCQKLGLLDWTILGGQNRQKTQQYLRQNGVQVDEAGRRHSYDLILTCTDLLIQKNLQAKNVILVQEGMTDPENFLFHGIRYLRRQGIKVPLWPASTSTTGLSDAYVKFCVASEGYRELFIQKGVTPEKIVVTGIPNFDNAKALLSNDFPHRNYVLVATTDTRENFKWDRRMKFLRWVKTKVGNEPVIFKLHPNEKAQRSRKEITRLFPDALVFDSGNTDAMVANCHTLITQFSSVVYLGLALGKRVYSYFDVEQLRQLVPIQNGGQSARQIAEVCRRYL